MATTLRNSDFNVARNIAGDRIEGWKSIGAYFGRDRTTAIRWARERNMPIHRIPGGKISTTFALRHELDAWASGVGITKPAAAPEPVATLTQTAANPVETPDESREHPGTKQRNMIGWIAAGLLVLFVAISVPGFVAADVAPDGSKPQPSSEILPKDPGVLERYLAARDLTATRNAQSLEQAIAMLSEVTVRAPEYAPGYAALAEALILSREFGIRSDENAFPAASFAASTALRLDPSLTEGYRMKGFVAYWWDQDIIAARAAFDEAIIRDPTNVMANFWYGNVLIDSGAFTDGLRRLNVARAMQPGSKAILTDLAWAQWSAGNTADGERNLLALTVEHPGFAVAHDSLGDTRLAAGDYAGYANAMATVAVLRQDNAMASRARAIQSSIQSGVPEAAYKTIMRYLLDDVTSDPRKTYLRPVFVASIAGDRAQTLTLLRRAALRSEKWGEAGIVRRMKARWVGDEAISKLLENRQSTAPN